VNQRARFWSSIAIAAGIILAASLLSFRPVYEPDLGWHLAHGREDAAGRLVRTNVFSSAYSDYRQRYTTWAFDVSAHFAWTLGGDTGVQALEALILIAALAFVYAACRVRASAFAAAVLLLLGFFVIEPRALPRPHLMSFAAMAACVWMVERAFASRTPTPLLWTIPIVALWSNFHAESVIGVTYLAIVAVAALLWPSAWSRRDAARALAIVGACAVALLATPYGAGLVEYMYENLSVPQLLNISELRPAYLPVYRGFYAFAVIAAAVVLFVKPRPALWEIAVMLGFGALGFRYLRLTPLLFLTTAPLVAARLSALVERGLDRRAVAVSAIAAALVMSRLPLGAWSQVFKRHAIFPATYFSAPAAQFARKAGLSGPVFNSFNLGGWVAWELYPQAQIFQDSRLQAYPPEHFARILEASRSQQAWDALVAGVDWAVLSRTRPDNLSGADRFPGDVWSIVFWDEAVTVLVRRRGRYAPVAAARGFEIVTPDANLPAIASKLMAGERERARVEAQRNRTDNPRGFLAAAVLCLLDEAAACADVDRLAKEDRSLENEADLVRILRTNK
jgi:hypothetical protein